MQILPTECVDDEGENHLASSLVHSHGSQQPSSSFSPQTSLSNPMSSDPHRGWSSLVSAPPLTSPPLPHRPPHGGFHHPPFSFSHISFPFLPPVPVGHTNQFHHPDSAIAAARDHTTSGRPSCQILSPPEFPHHSPLFFPPPPPPPPPPPLVQPPARILVDTWKRLEPPPFLRLPDSRDAWLAHARTRRAAYAHTFALPALRWILVEDGEGIPADAIQTGVEATGEPLYSVRTWYNDGLHLGKGGHHIFKGCSVSWGSQEYAFGTFEVLVGNPSLAQWVEITSTSKLDGSDDAQIPASPVSLSPLTLTPLALPTALPSLKAPKLISSTIPSLSNQSKGVPIRPFFAIEGGFEPTTVASTVTPFGQTPPSPKPILQQPLVTLFIAQAFYADGWHPGKVESGDDHCCIGWGGGEVWVKDFRVLSWAL